MNVELPILLTGATGFLGSRLIEVLYTKPNTSLTCVVRSGNQSVCMNTVSIDGLDGDVDLSGSLDNQKVVIHTAARAHIMKEDSVDPLAEYRRVNVDGTLNLARQAAAAGVRRFIFISSIKVNGEETRLGKPFTADDAPSPEDSYGLSKLEAEQGLQKLAVETGMEVVVIRPPLVYGPGVKGNFASMIRLVEKGLPLPLGSIYNQRSLVSLDNLVDLIIRCIDHPAAANQVFLVSDGHDLSTTELFQCVANAMSKPSRLLPVPSGLMMFVATILGKKAVAKRLLGSLQVDISKTRDMLDWEPPVSVDEGLKRCF